jgi:hypothetical protein
MSNKKQPARLDAIYNKVWELRTMMVEARNEGATIQITLDGQFPQCPVTFTDEFDQVEVIATYRR